MMSTSEILTQLKAGGPLSIEAEEALKTIASLALKTDAAKQGYFGHNLTTRALEQRAQLAACEALQRRSLRSDWAAIPDSSRFDGQLGDAFQTIVGGLLCSVGVQAPDQLPQFTRSYVAEAIKRQYPQPTQMNALACLMDSQGVPNISVLAQVIAAAQAIFTTTNYGPAPLAAKKMARTQLQAVERIVADPDSFYREMGARFAKINNIGYLQAQPVLVGGGDPQPAVAASLTATLSGGALAGGDPITAAAAAASGGAAAATAAPASAAAASASAAAAAASGSVRPSAPTFQQRTMIGEGTPLLGGGQATDPDPMDAAAPEDVILEGGANWARASDVGVFLGHLCHLLLLFLLQLFVGFSTQKGRTRKVAVAHVLAILGTLIGIHVHLWKAACGDFEVYPSQATAGAPYPDCPLNAGFNNYPHDRPFTQASSNHSAIAGTILMTTYLLLIPTLCFFNTRTAKKTAKPANRPVGTKRQTWWHDPFGPHLRKKWKKVRRLWAKRRNAKNSGGLSFANPGFSAGDTSVSSGSELQTVIATTGAQGEFRRPQSSLNAGGGPLVLDDQLLTESDADGAPSLGLVRQQTRRGRLRPTSGDSVGYVELGPNNEGDYFNVGGLGNGEYLETDDGETTLLSEADLENWRRDKAIEREVFADLKGTYADLEEYGEEYEPLPRTDSTQSDDAYRVAVRAAILADRDYKIRWAVARSFGFTTSDFQKFESQVTLRENEGVNDELYQSIVRAFYQNRLREIQAAASAQQNAGGSGSRPRGPWRGGNHNGGVGNDSEA